MFYCFIHAPIDNGWNGELLLALEKKTHFRVAEVEKLCGLLFPNEDFCSLYYDDKVFPDRLNAYQLRRERGMMQRISISGTYEDLHFDEWIKALTKHYPHLAKYVKFLLIDQPMFARV